MAICPIICLFYYLARALMHEVVCGFGCAVGCAETISANALNKHCRVSYREILGRVRTFAGKRKQPWRPPLRRKRRPHHELIVLKTKRSIVLTIF